MGRCPSRELWDQWFQGQHRPLGGHTVSPSRAGLFRLQLQTLQKKLGSAEGLFSDSPTPLPFLICVKDICLHILHLQPEFELLEYTSLSET